MDQLSEIEKKIFNNHLKTKALYSEIEILKQENVRLKKALDDLTPIDLSIIPPYPILKTYNPTPISETELLYLCLAKVRDDNTKGRIILDIIKSYGGKFLTQIDSKYYNEIKEKIDVI